MNYFDEMLENISKKHNTNNLLRNIINPFSPYFICDYCISHESKIIEIHLKNILKSKELPNFQENDIIQCQVDLLDHFIDKILPNIQTNIILITSQRELPQIHQSKKTDELLNHPKISLWISQNPIYPESDKYHPFPYGVDHKRIHTFYKKLFEKNKKEINLNHLYCSNTHLSREKLPNGPKYNLDEYYDQVKKSNFLISPIGDRDDCYRHYECIAFETIPISNISENYKSIFGDNMLYKNINKIKRIIETNKIKVPYTPPNKNLICLSYYVNIINQKLKNLGINKTITIN